MTSTGYAYEVNGDVYTGLVTSSPLKGSNRLFYIRKMITEILDKTTPSVVAFEGYAMGARGNNMFHIGELGGVLKTLIWERGIDYCEIPPTVMKSVIALNGRADKGEISKALERRFGLLINQQDEADAAGLLIAGQIRVGARNSPQDSRQSTRIDALMACPLVAGKPQLKSISK